ncbi:MAG: response regulator [bacterium]
MQDSKKLQTSNGKNGRLIAELIADGNIHGRCLMMGNILIASRDDACRNKLLKIFTGKGLSVHSVWEDTDLLIEVLERDYDLIIYDLELSDLNGFKMVKIIRKMRPKLALFVVSGNPSKELGGKILQEGVAYYALKPIDPNAIKEALFTALKHS